MRARPRTWPSIRLSRLSTDVLASARMPSIYPYGYPFQAGIASWNALSAFADGRRDRHRSGLRHDGRSGEEPAPAHAIAATTYYFCSAGCRTKFAADPQKYLGDARPPRRAHGARGRDLYLPDASRSPPGRPGRLPDLRHGARARDRDGRRGGQSRTRRHDAPVLDRPRSRACRSWCWKWAAISSVRAWLPPTLSNFDPIRLRHAGRAVGRLAVLRARLRNRCVTRNLNMFTLIAHGHRRRLCSTAWSPRSRPALFPPAFRDAHGGDRAFISRPPP